MRVKVLILDGDHRLAQDGREAIVAHHLATLQREGADLLSIAIVERGDGGRAIVFEFVDLRQIGGVDQRKPGQRTGHDSQHQQHDERRPAGNLAAAMRRQDRGPAAPIPPARFPAAVEW